MSAPSAIKCPVCARTSYHPDDVAHGYCGRCHAFTSAGCAYPPSVVTDPCTLCGHPAAAHPIPDQRTEG